MADVNRCSKCKTMKKAKHFSPCKANRNGLYSWCKQCTAERYRERYAGKPKNQVSEEQWEKIRIKLCKEKLLFWQTELAKLLKPKEEKAISVTFALPRGLDLD